MSKFLLKLFDKIPAIQRVSKDVEKRQRRASISFHRADTANEEVKTLIRENGFSRVLVLDKEEK